MQRLSVSHCCFNYFQYCLPSSPDHRVQPQLSRPEQLIQDHQKLCRTWIWTPPVLCWRKNSQAKSFKVEASVVAQ
ncbi:hypothetical protein R3I94_021629 [Phoxinus phoxinus]